MRRWVAWTNGAVARPPTLRFRTFTVTLHDGRLDVNDRDFGPVGPSRITIRGGAVFVGGEHRSSFRE